MNDEKVRDVCAEMIDHADFCIEKFGCDQVNLRRYAQKLSEAYEREIAEKDAAHRQWRDNYKSRLSEKDAEIARLKTAIVEMMHINEENENGKKQ